MLAKRLVNGQIIFVIRLIADIITNIWCLEDEFSVIKAYDFGRVLCYFVKIGIAYLFLSVCDKIHLDSSSIFGRSSQNWVSSNEGIY